MFEEFEGFVCATSAWLKPLVDAINAVDIWLENQTKNFEFGKSFDVNNYKSKRDK